MKYPENRLQYLAGSKEELQRSIVELKQVIVTLESQVTLIEWMQGKEGETNDRINVSTG